MCSECEEIVKEEIIIYNEIENNIKTRKMFWEVLPKWEEGKYKGTINWKECIECKVKGIYDGLEFEVEIVGYKSKGQYLWIKYLDKEPFRIKTGNFLYCKMGKLLNKHTDEFKLEISTIFKDDKRDMTIINRKYIKEERIDNQGSKSIVNRKWYQYKCNKCGFCDDRSWMIESSVLRGIGCACCDGKIIVEHINSIVANTETHWMIPYFQGGYDEAKGFSKGSHTKLIFKCPDCGRIRNKLITIKTLNRTHSIGCSCSDGKSYPEKFMFSVLEQLNIEFETELSPEWCKYYVDNNIKSGRYDFYFEYDNKKYIVETDGEWHVKDNTMSGQTKEESNEIDDYKDELAREHNIVPIRIDCDKSELNYIKDSILSSKLNDLFDFSKVNWLKSHEFALSNLVKIVCEYKKNNTDLINLYIGKIMKLSHVTIITYLKQGSELGWINYNAKEERLKGQRKIGKNGKKVEIFKDGKSLGIFSSCCELARQGEILFGVKLISSSVSMVCIGRRNHHKGFTFKYIENNLKEVI